MPDNMQVQIEVLDEDNSVQEWYRLPTEDVIHQITRTPVVFPIPSVNRGDRGGMPTAYALDFGMMNEQITIKGVAYDYEEDTDIPSSQDMAQIARTGWRYVTISTDGGEIVVKGGVRIIINHGYNQGTWTYQGVVQSFTSTRVGGGTHWQWQMVLQVTKWPISNDIVLGSE